MLLRMCKRKTSIDSLKCIPHRIHNKIDLPIGELVVYFQTHPLNDCAKKYSCSAITIKRKLRAAGKDTSIHNHSKLAKIRSSEVVSKKKPTPTQLKELLIDRNLDSKTIAEMFGLHFNTIRGMAKDLGLSKTPKQVSKSMMNRHMLKHGVAHPAQRPDVIAKTSISLNKASYSGYQFKSLSELGFALLLDHDGIEWAYEEMRIPYVDMMTGKRRIYVVDFTVINEDGILWIEVKPNNNMIPEDKRIYASRRAEESGVIYRGLFEEERSRSWGLITSGYKFDEIEFLQRTPRSTSQKITYYFKNEKDAILFEMEEWRQFTKPTNNGALWKKILVRK